jgi:hypothetical protein
VKGVAVFLLAVFLVSLPLEAAFAQTQAQETESAAPAPEFPQWARDLRRGEIIAFGAFPFTLFFATSIYETWKWGYYDNFSWDQRRYAPWPLKPPGAERLNNDEFLAVMGIAAGTAILIAVIDHIIIRVRRSRAAREAARIPQGEVRVNRSPWPPEDAPPETESP